ncbi:hypothetical protein BC828DRAFT_385101 [Blastocladiella britannica]|nr:hypothetical protein BC828DRAFT_385101 [Blastocladiella britannica]
MLNIPEVANLVLTPAAALADDFASGASVAAVLPVSHAPDVLPALFYGLATPAPALMASIGHKEFLALYHPKFLAANLDRAVQAAGDAGHTHLVDWLYSSFKDDALAFSDYARVTTALFTASEAGRVPVLQWYKAHASTCPAIQSALSMVGPRARDSAFLRGDSATVAFWTTSGGHPIQWLPDMFMVHVAKNNTAPTGSPSLMGFLDAQWNALSPTKRCKTCDRSFKVTANAAATAGSLAMLVWLHKRHGEVFPGKFMVFLDECSQLATSAGQVNVLTWLADTAKIRRIQFGTSLNSAAAGGHLGALCWWWSKVSKVPIDRPIGKWDTGSGTVEPFRISDDAIRRASIQGHDAVLHWLWDTHHLDHMRCYDIATSTPFFDELTSVSMLVWWRARLGTYFPLKSYTTEAVVSGSARAALPVLDWWWLRSSIEKMPFRTTKDAVHKAAEHGHLTSLTWWLARHANDKFPMQFDSDVLTLASKAGHCSVLEWWAASSRDFGIAFDFSPACVTNAAIGGHPDCLKFWLNYTKGDAASTFQGIPEAIATSSTTDDATRYTVLAWWRDEVLEPAQKTTALRNKWAKSKHIRGMISAATARGSLALVRLCHEIEGELGIPPLQIEPTAAHIDQASGAGLVVMLLYWHRLYCSAKKTLPHTPAAYTHAAKNGHLLVLEFWRLALGLQLKWTPLPAEETFKNGFSIPALKWIWSHRGAIEPFKMKMVQFPSQPCQATLKFWRGVFADLELTSLAEAMQCNCNWFVADRDPTKPCTLTFERAGVEAEEEQEEEEGDDDEDEEEESDQDAQDDEDYDDDIEVARATGFVSDAIRRVNARFAAEDDYEDYYHER